MKVAHSFEGPGTTHPAIRVTTHNTILDYTHVEILKFTKEKLMRTDQTQ
jgi:hypothetical protein